MKHKANLKWSIGPFQKIMCVGILWAGKTREAEAGLKKEAAAGHGQMAVTGKKRVVVDLVAEERLGAVSSMTGLMTDHRVCYCMEHNSWSQIHSLGGMVHLRVQDWWKVVAAIAIHLEGVLVRVVKVVRKCISNSPTARMVLTGGHNTFHSNLIQAV